MSGVLIVDDNAAFRAAARALLEAGGYRVVGEAGTGEAGITQALLTGPDIVLLDIGLPDFDGFRVCARLRELMPSAVVVLCSVRDAEQYGDAVLRSGAEFLAKRRLSAEALAAVVQAERR